MNGPLSTMSCYLGNFSRILGRICALNFIKTRIMLLIMGLNVKESKCLASETDKF